jgi:ligand-binding sensor domain-containing protein
MVMDNIARYQYAYFCRQWLMLLLVLVMGTTAEAQIESKLCFRRYTTQDGLPQMQTERVWQDARGYIYIGTLSGFVRFDGHGFTPFLKGRRENIVGFVEAGGVRALGFRRQWLTDDDGVEMRLIDPAGHWLLNNFNAGSLPDGYVLLEDEREEQRRLCKVTEEGFLPVLTGALLDSMTYDRKLTIDTTGIYVPTEGGLYRVNGRKAVRLTAKGDVFTLLRTGSELLAFAADGIYLVTANGLLLKTAYHFEAPDYGLTVRRLAEGHLVVSDSHSLYEYDGKHIHKRAGGFNLVKDVLVDRWSRLWVATYEGLYCFFNRCFSTHRLADADDIVRAIGVLDSCELVLGSLNGKLIANGRLVNEGGGEAFFGPCAATLDSAVYMLGNGDVMRYDGTAQWLHLPHDRYQFVAEAGGRLIIGNRKGVVAYQPKTKDIDTLTTEVPHPWCAATDGNGTLWVGSSFGLYQITPDMKTTKTDYPQKLVITTMDRTPQGDVLFASADSLYRIHNGQVTSLNGQIPELSGHEVRSIHVSPKGYLVVAVIEGLFVCRISQDGLLSDCRYFDHSNGFVALEPLKATMAETADGMVWLAGIEEITSMKPAELLAFPQEDTYIMPPLRWWQHWWIWLIVLMLLSLLIWLAAKSYERRKSRMAMVHLAGENLKKEKQLDVIRKKAIAAEENALAKDIIRLTEKPENTRMVIDTSHGKVVFDTIDIAYFKADGNYTRMVTFKSSETLIVGLGKLARTLDPKIFIRADRSTVVNIHNISRLDAQQRHCIFRSADGTEVETTLLAPAFKRLEGIL